MVIRFLRARHFPWLVPLLVLTLVRMPAAAADDWKFDVVHLKNGNTIQGLIVEDSPGEVRVRSVNRHPGKPMVVLTVTLQRGEVERLELLEGADREQLVERLKSLAAERQTWAALLRAVDPA